MGKSGNGVPPRGTDPEIEETIRMVNAGRGTSWYEADWSEVDFAVARLCMLRRASADEHRSAEGGDADVRKVLEQAEPDAVVWLAARVISYMDEHGFPELIR